MSIKKITLPFAKAYILEKQLLSKANTIDLQSIIEQIGYVQIDTISVVERAHHHVLWNRFPNYQSSHLQELEEVERGIFEYWAHAASYLPMKDYRFSLYRKSQIAAQNGHWYTKDKALMKKVYHRLDKDGPLMSRDFEKKASQSDHAWGGHPIKRAIQQLFMEGEIMISGRQNFQKVNDLPTRILPSHVDTSLPTREEYLRYIIRRDIRAHGLIKSRDIGHLLTGTKKDIVKILDKMLHEKEIYEVQIKGREPDIYYAFPESLEAFQPTRIAKKVQILSPFDNVLILRKRLAEVFDFEYTLECYVTAAKRKVGYFSLPLLYGNTFIGQIDLKVDRKTKILWIKNLVWEKDFEHKKTIQTALINSIKKFSHFNNCEKIQVIPERKSRISMIF